MKKGKEGRATLVATNSALLRQGSGPEKEKSHHQKGREVNGNSIVGFISFLRYRQESGHLWKKKREGKTFKGEGKGEEQTISRQ